MTNFINIDGKDFIFFSGVSVPANLVREHGVIVRHLDVELASDDSEYSNYHTQFAVKQLAAKGVSVDTHVAVAGCHEDLSGWCDIEQKYEYFSEDWDLMVPKSLMAQFAPNPSEVRAWDEAASLGFSDWA